MRRKEINMGRVTWEPPRKVWRKREGEWGVGETYSLQVRNQDNGQVLEDGKDGDG
jgi:hypothetical protein